MVTDINGKHRLRRQYVQMSVFCSVLGLLCVFLAAVWFSGSEEIDFSDFHEIWEGIRNIRGNVLFVWMFIGGMAVAFFDVYQYYGYLRERNSLRDEENGSAKWAKEGYVILCFNTENMARSMRYNPFAYVKSTSDIPKLVNALTTNIEGQ